MLDFTPWACQDFSKESFKVINSSLPKIPVPDNLFDIAVATEVLEHLDCPERTLSEMARVVRGGGSIMCSVPNNTLGPSVELEHQQIFTTSRLTRMLSEFSNTIHIKTGKMFRDLIANLLLYLL